MGALDLAVELYQMDGVTLVQDITAQTTDVKWQEVSSQPGTGSCKIVFQPGTLFPSLDRYIVKFRWRGTVRFAMVIRTEELDLGSDGMWTLQVTNQPGVMAILNGSLVDPEYGLQRLSASQRTFGFMSAQSDWYDPADWNTPVANSFYTDPVHKNLPPNLRGSHPSWIAASPGPSSTVAAGAQQWFRYKFTTTSVQSISVNVAGDDFLAVYLDGQEIVSPDYSKSSSTWRTGTLFNLLLPIGDHVLAARVENMIIKGTNPVAFACTIDHLDSHGNFVNTIARTGFQPFLVATDSPGWFPAQVLYVAYHEAAARGDLAPILLSLGFSGTVDSNGDAYNQDRNEFVFDINSTGLAEIATQLAESGVDFWVDPDTMTLQCANLRGADRTGTVTLHMGDGGNIMAGSKSTRTYERFTTITTQLASGAWVRTDDSAAIATLGGRVNEAASLGSTSSDLTAQTFATKQLAESAKPTLSASYQLSTQTGPQVGTDFDMGDRIVGPTHVDPGTFIGRVLMLTFDASAEVMQLQVAVTESDA